MPFEYKRTVRFADTDAAGVVFFANYLALCHEAYEEALAYTGIELNTFFEASGLVIPITKSEANYLRPLFPGDKLTIICTPRLLTENSFELSFELWKAGPPDKLAARLKTEHVCIASETRERKALDPRIASWINGG
jgi:1,4-dihydroxy-2-naphthoyl-CoA hydrolase